MYIPKGKEKVEKESLEVVAYKGGLLIREVCGDVNMSVSLLTEQSCKKNCFFHLHAML